MGGRRQRPRMRVAYDFRSADVAAGGEGAPFAPIFHAALAERLGSELLVLDQTRPEIDLPVVKVIVPGLRHFWARFAPGRLYDVPVKLGWLARPRAEEELNPIPMFL